MYEIRVGSLFSGIGGIELGFEKVGGFKTEWFIESEPYSQRILRERFPNTPIYGDITEIDFAEVPRIDVLTGGFPCQDISNAGKRAGIKGSRSSLWSYFTRAISVLRPRFVLAENVSALTNRGLGTVLCDLASLGYDAEWHCVPAAAVGAYHKRDRIFIMAHPKSERDSGLDTRQWREGQRETIFAGNGENVAHADRRSISESEVPARWNTALRCGADVPNTIGNGSREEPNRWPHKSSMGTMPNTDQQRLQGQFSEEQETRESKEKSRRRGFWATEPRVGRVVDGIPNRVDRIKALGNAVVPQVAEVFAEAIKEVNKEDKPRRR